MNSIELKELSNETEKELQKEFKEIEKICDEKLEQYYRRFEE